MENTNVIRVDFKNRRTAATDLPDTFSADAKRLLAIMDARKKRLVPNLGPTTFPLARPRL